MTLLRKSNSLTSYWISLLRNDTYIIINIVFAGVILLILAYSGIYSPDKNNYPVACIHENITGDPCFSCGLSHSFSLIIRGRFDEAYHRNIYGMRVFLFFVTQLLMRVVFSLYYLKELRNRKELIYFDIAGSVAVFAIVFYPFFIYIFTEMF
jgi:hypothetical protein